MAFSHEQMPSALVYSENKYFYSDNMSIDKVYIDVLLHNDEKIFTLFIRFQMD